MALVNHRDREVTFKIVYCGTPLGGKTSNLSAIHTRLADNVRGDLISMATGSDSTVFFDYLHVNTVVINGYSTKFQLYTVPGQSQYNATRQLLLRGADGVIFVADSHGERMEENLAAFHTMMRNLEANSIRGESFPIVLQYNKRDLPEAAPVHHMDFLFNSGDRKFPTFEASALQYVNVVETLDAVTQIILEQFHQKTPGGIQVAPRGVQPAQTEGAGAEATSTSN